MKRTKLFVCALGAVFSGCGGDDSGTSADVPPAVCMPTNACVCADNGPPDFSRAGTGAPTDGSTDEQRAALQRTNYWRTAAGLPPINANAELEAAASAHSQFMATTMASCWSGAHNEVSSCTGFTGASPGARATHAGYRANALGEVINWNATPTAAIDGWIWTVYHRTPFTDIGYTEAGYGTAEGPYNGRPGHHNTMDFGRPAGTPTPTQMGVVVFPPPGTTDVPPAFNGNLEGPTPPMPASGRWPSGTVISLNFPTDNYEVTEHKLYDSLCNEVAHSYFTSATDSNNHNRRFVFFYANAPLTTHNDYTVRVSATVNGEPWTKTWQFRTR